MRHAHRPWNLQIVHLNNSTAVSEMEYSNQTFSLTAFKHDSVKHSCRAGRILPVRLRSTLTNRSVSAAWTGHFDGCVAAGRRLRRLPSITVEQRLSGSSIIRPAAGGRPAHAVSTRRPCRPDCGQRAASPAETPPRRYGGGTVQPTLEMQGRHQPDRHCSCAGLASTPPRVPTPRRTPVPPDFRQARDTDSAVTGDISTHRSHQATGVSPDTWEQTN